MERLIQFPFLKTSVSDGATRQWGVGINFMKEDMAGSTIARPDFGDGVRRTPAIRREEQSNRKTSISPKTKRHKGVRREREKLLLFDFPEEKTKKSF